MADVTYQPKVYRQQGGDNFVVATGGTAKFEPGASFDFHSGALEKDTSVGITTANRHVYCYKGAFTGTASTAGGIFNWQAPTGSAIIIQSFAINITAASATAGCVLDIGTATTSATTKGDNLIDGLVATGSITGYYDSVDDQGTNGKQGQYLAAGKWITGSATNSKATSLAGNYYVTYLVA